MIGAKLTGRHRGQHPSAGVMSARHFSLRHAGGYPAAMRPASGEDARTAIMAHGASDLEAARVTSGRARRAYAGGGRPEGRPCTGGIVRCALYTGSPPTRGQGSPCPYATITFGFAAWTCARRSWHTVRVISKRHVSRAGGHGERTQAAGRPEGRPCTGGIVGTLRAVYRLAANTRAGRALPLRDDHIRIRGEDARTAIMAHGASDLEAVRTSSRRPGRASPAPAR